MLKILSACTLLCMLALPAHSQFIKKLGQKVKDKVNERVDQKTDQAIDHSLDKTEEAAKGHKGGSGNNGQSSDSNNSGGGKEPASQVPTLQTYRNYDFVPGDTIIFQSNLADEQVGEIPSQFTVLNGQMDVQEDNGENVIHVPKGAGATMTPRMTNATYMPDQFTVEFDFKNETFGMNHLMVDFGQRVYYSGGEDITPGMTFGSDNITWTLGDVAYPEGLNLENPMKWHHVAVAINKTVGKVYIDQFRVANVNNLTGKPQNVTIDVNGYENSFIKNIRIAAGGINIYKQSTTPARIVMHGILFDVDKAVLRPESMGSINEIYNLMKKNPSLKFEIDGHTDNTGDAAHNLTLSQQRADAVKAQLVSMGIDGSRLSTKGFGDTKPMDGNDTPEGRANNRRVEFIKQ